MHTEESAVTRSRRPILLVDADPMDLASGADAATSGGFDREALASAALEVGFVARTAANWARAHAQLERAGERLDALVTVARQDAAGDGVEALRAVRRLRPALPIVVATPEAESARKLRSEIEAAAVPGVRWASPATPDAILACLRSLPPR